MSTIVDDAGGEDLALTEAELELLEQLDQASKRIRWEVQAVASQHQTGCYLWGRGGIGKSLAVYETLQRLEPVPYV